MSLNTDVPTPRQVEQLLELRSPYCVSIYLPSTVIGPDQKASKLELRNLAGRAVDQLTAAGARAAEVDAVRGHFDALVEDEEFWDAQSRSIAVFATPESCLTLRLPNRLPSEVEVGDRFYVKPLLRAIAFPQAGYVLALAAGSVRLIEYVADGPAESIRLPDMPAGAASAAGKSSLSDRAPIRRIQGSEGQKLRLTQYARKIDIAIRPSLTGADLPLVLAATEPIASVYRQVNTYPGLVTAGIPGSPEGRSEDDLAAAARLIVDDLYRRQVRELTEQVEERAAGSRSSTDLATLAFAATNGLVDTLLVDFEQRVPGLVDEEGTITLADVDDHASYGVVDEVVRRVLRTGGRVLAVRGEDLRAESAAAGILRYPLLGSA